MNRLITIQKRNNLNVVFRDDEPGPGGACHDYMIGRESEDKTGGITLLNVRFQKGPRTESTSVNGVLDVDLIEIVRDRLTAFQNGDFRCRENAIALTHIEEALLWMNKRVEDRAERGVLGTTNK